MKQLLLLFLAFSLSVSKAENPGERKIALVNQLMTVNQEWIKQPECNKILNEIRIPQNCSYTELISIHLSRVEKTLRDRNCSSLSAEQKYNRLTLLDKLNSYWKNKIFPVNDYVNYKTPVFIDKKGTHCAVGYLMQQSGVENLAQEINSKQKFAFVSEIKVAGVTEWANKNGFTLVELAWIQPNYSPTTQTSSLDSGFNASVNVILPDANSNIVYVGGSFTKSISGTDCNHIAAWVSGFAGWDWMSLGDGVNGDVNTILIHNNKLIVGGDFKAAGSVIALHIAVYNLYSQQWQSMGSLDNIVRSLVVYNGEVYAAGDFAGNVAKWNGTSWQTINVQLTGSVRTLEVWNSLLVIGGDFELNTGALRKHAVAYDGTQMVLMGFGTKTPVNDFEIFNDTLYAGCDYIDKGDTCAIAKYANGEWVTVLKKQQSSTAYFFYLNSIKQLKSHDNSLYVAGDFYLGGIMFGGRGLLKADEAFLSYQTVLDVDSTIKALAFMGNQFYFGGDFTHQTSWLSLKELNRIGSFETVITNTINREDNSGIKIYPNPAVSSVTVSFDNNDNLKSLCIYNSLSQLIYQKDISSFPGNKMNVPVAELPDGIYSVVLSSAEKRFMQKLVVQH